MSMALALTRRITSRREVLMSRLNAIVEMEMEESSWMELEAIREELESLGELQQVIYLEGVREQL